MEKKNNTKSIKKPVKKVTKKILKNEKINNTSKRKKKKGFTLIELLAVIIILGILMIIAIPSVTKYINDSRKSSYVDTAKEIIAGARNIVNSGELGMYDTDTTYYINSECIKTENALKSPYGDFTKAYVVVTFDGKGYEYFWTSVDETGQGIKKITRIDKLDTDSIESDLKLDDIPDSLGINGRSYYMIIDKEHTNCGKGNSTDVSDFVSGETGERSIIYPEGKNKSNVVIGDKVTIGTEEFYVINNNNSKLTLLSHYNLNVGNSKKSDEPEGIQSNNVVGNKAGFTTYGTLSFASTNYWKDKSGEGLTYPGTYSSTQPPYVYDSNSYCYQYIETYKNYLEKYGVKIKEARLIKYSEVVSLGCRPSGNCPGQYKFVYETSYKTGSANDSHNMWYVNSMGRFDIGSYNSSNFSGVRPVIVI